MSLVIVIGLNVIFVALRLFTRQETHMSILFLARGAAAHSDMTLRPLQNISEKFLLTKK